MREGPSSADNNLGALETGVSLTEELIMREKVCTNPLERSQQRHCILSERQKTWSGHLMADFGVKECPRWLVDQSPKRTSLSSYLFTMRDPFFP